MIHTMPEGGKPGYALVTAAYNEEKFIQRTIESIVDQTVPPQKWIIVSDGSTDRTDEIVETYARQCGFVELYRITEEHPRNFTAQVNAINAGFARLRASGWHFIGNLDSDITLDPDYFEKLLERFSKDPGLGVAGGFIYEEENGNFVNRRSNSIDSVAHGVQLFRRECLEALGGYTPFSWGGSDSHAVVRARMNGWRAESVSELKAFHHRPTGGGFGGLRYQYKGGQMDFYLGTHPVFEMFRMARRFRSKPYVIGPIARLAGFAWGYVSGQRRQASPEFIRFFRAEQMNKLRALWTWRSANPRMSKRSEP
jgi:glycosyltransferase involved in cell wall biosynthesis